MKYSVFVKVCTVSIQEQVIMVHVGYKKIRLLLQNFFGTLFALFQLTTTVLFGAAVGPVRDTETQCEEIFSEVAIYFL